MIHRNAQTANEPFVTAETANNKAARNGVALPVTEQDANVRLHELGQQFREYLEGAKHHFIDMAVVLAAAKAEVGRAGCDSGFPAWLAEHAPELDRKTVDRLVSIATAFRLNTDNVSTFKPLAERFRLTALYQLSGENVPEKARTEALAGAEAGRTVTLADAKELIEKNTITSYLKSGNGRAKKPRTKTYRRTIALPAGKIQLAINHEDYRQALTEALDLVDEN